MSGQVSLCMIARNEQANLAGCLAPMAGLVHEIVVVDTGSSDGTREAAGRLGARVVDFPWIDDFSAARNESVRQATCPWIFWLDADDRVDDVNRGRLQTLFGGLKTDNAAYLMKCQGVADAATGSASITEHIRLFPNHPEVRWRYRVHEQILPALSSLGAEIRATDVVIQHTGYGDPALLAGKSERNLRILEQAVAENPVDPHALFYLGQTHMVRGALDRALPLLRECLRFAGLKNPITPRVYVLLIQGLYQVGAHTEALSLCQNGRLHFPDNPDLLFLEGVVRQAYGDEAGAEACWLSLLGGPAGARAGTMDPSMYLKARYRLAQSYLKQGRLGEAEAQWQAVLAESPHFTPAWLALADVCQARGRSALWEPLLQSAAALGGNGLNHALLMARFHEARGDAPAARDVLERASAQFSRALWPRLLLARMLLQEGRDWPAAERALRAVLEVEPHNAEARRNLMLLERRLGRG